jgi:hypothetical protein
MAYDVVNQADPNAVTRSTNNLYWNATRSSPQFFWLTTPYRSLAAFQQGTNRETNSLAEDPKFTRASAGDFTLQATSPAIDRGGFLTQSIAAGSGTLLPVQDARYFSDGYGLIPGDLIQLQGQTATARVSAVDYSANTLTLETPLSWTAGQGVSYAYAGSTPDIGAHERGMVTH